VKTNRENFKGYKYKNKSNHFNFRRKSRRCR